MEKLLYQIKNSWFRCFEKGLSKKLKGPQNYSGTRQLKQQQERNGILIQVFEDQALEIAEKYRLTKPLIILANRQGLILTRIYSKEIAGEVERSGLKEGVYLTEASCGTNAVAMAMESGKTVYLNEEAHYCHFLQNWKSVSAPIKLGNEVAGYLGLFIFHNRHDQQLLILFELLLTRIMINYRERHLNLLQRISRKVALSEQQKQVLKLSAMGYSIREISRKLYISQATVKYHRMKVCEQLGAANITHAIAKAIKYGFLDVNTINL